MTSVLAAACAVHAGAVWAPTLVGVFAASLAATVVRLRQGTRTRVVRAAALTGAVATATSLPVAMWLIAETEPGCNLVVAVASRSI